MKKFLVKTAAALCVGLCAFSFAACSSAGKSVLLGSPAQAANFNYSERTEDYLEFSKSVDGFAAKFAASAYASYSQSSNFAVSPVSVYMALSLAAECADGDTRTEILDALGVTYGQLQDNIGKLYRSLNKQYTAEGYFGSEKVVSFSKTANSIWVNEGTTVNKSCIDALSQKYYAYSYSADFAYDNANANKAVSHFVKEQTNGLIDTDFELDEQTAFTLINTLYLKEIWKYNGDELEMTDDAYDFAGEDGVKSLKLLMGKYYTGRAYEGENFTYFYATTYHGYKIKFILPDEGYSADDVFTAENLAEVNAVTDFNSLDEENLIRYNTRCLFPEYSASYDGDVKEILGEYFGVDSLFSEEDCDMANLTGDSVYCNNVRHITDLTVNRKGIEGSAVTVIVGAGAAGPDEYRDVYNDFVVDRPFGFILTDSYGVTLFSGVVKNV